MTNQKFNGDDLRPGDSVVFENGHKDVFKDSPKDGIFRFFSGHIIARSFYPDFVGRIVDVKKNTRTIDVILSEIASACSYNEEVMKLVLEYGEEFLREKIYLMRKDD